MHDFRKLLVWQKAMELAKAIDAVLPRLREWKPNLAGQLEDAVDAIPAFIAEGCGRESKADFRRFLTMSIGAANGAEHRLLRFVDRGLLDSRQGETLVNSTIEIRKMLYALKRSI